MKRLGTRVNLIPVIAKADTLTQNDLAVYKQRIREVVAAQGIRIYTPPVDADDEAAAEHARVLQAAMPFSIIGSTEDVNTPDGRVVKGREYLWGVAEGMCFFLSCGPYSLSYACAAVCVIQLRTRTTATSASCDRSSFARTCSI